MTLLIVSDDLPSAQVAALALTAAGETVLATVPCANLVREVVRLAPQTVIAVVAGEGPGQCSALLASLLPSAQAAAQAAAAAVTIQAFEASLGALEQSPLATAAIRAALVQARTQWQALLDGLRRAAGPDVAAGRAALALQSDRLLVAFEQLTTLYERSHQVLMG